MIGCGYIDHHQAEVQIFGIVYCTDIKLFKLRFRCASHRTIHPVYNSDNYMCTKYMPIEDISSVYSVDVLELLKQ